MHVADAGACRLSPAKLALTVHCPASFGPTVTASENAPAGLAVTVWAEAGVFDDVGGVYWTVTARPGAESVPDTDADGGPPDTGQATVTVVRCSATVKWQIVDTAAVRERSPMNAARARHAPATDGVKPARHRPRPSAPTGTVTGFVPDGPVKVTTTPPAPRGAIDPDAAAVDATPAVTPVQPIDTDDVLGRVGAPGVRASAAIVEDRTRLPPITSTRCSPLGVVPCKGIVKRSVRPPGTLKKPL